MGRDTPVAPAGPDLGRPDARAVFVTQWYVPDRAAGTRLLDEVADAWRAADPPDGLLAFHAHLSTDGDTVLAYAQARDPDAYRPFVRSLRGAARAEPVEYRLRRGVVLASSARPPGCAVVATFDVDGAERQDRIIESVVGALDGAPADQHRGMLSAHFHTSTDGSRVLNYARWTSDEAHEAFLAGATRRATLRATGATPGVRPIGFKRYHLHHAIDLGRSRTGRDRSTS
ncbi:antibiotic biosynthesis monooxygenase family protein [Streptomyces sp. NPDC058052]|uniref:antibiotic biosynthesis monooxygenase family protein n=1 Tax=Streptomyces sp. NPDC058052 TaxID=3346316 RepID=UPI0036E8C2A6